MVLLLTGVGQVGLFAFAWRTQFGGVPRQHHGREPVLAHRHRLSRPEGDRVDPQRTRHEGER
jgi:hypothetical protein